MITLLILLLLTASLCSIKYKKTHILLLSSTFSLFILTSTGIISSVLLKWTAIDPAIIKFKENNALILLGGGIVNTGQKDQFKPAIFAYSRIYETARIYNLCKKTAKHCTIIISGGDPLFIGASEAFVYQTALIELGIPKTNIILERASKNTFENAKFTSLLIKAHHFDYVTLITSHIHMKRALLYFAHFGINAIGLCSDYIPSNISFNYLGFQFALTDFIVHEYIGILRFYVYQNLGLNK